MYVQSADYIDLSWNVIDSSKISTVKWAAGTLPFLDDVHAFTETEQYRLQNGDLHLPNGETLWVYITAEDEAGNVGSALSSPVTSDMTSPSIHNIDCNPTISKASCILLCSWEKAEELESELWALQIGIGSSGNLQDIQMYKSIHFEKQQWSKDIKQHIADFQGFEIFVHFRVSNVFDFEQSYVVKVGIDETPPDIESVLIVTTMDTSDDDTAIQQVCQLPTTYIEIALGEIVDIESDIQRLELALGTEVSQEDILSYTDIPLSVGSKLLLGHLSLVPGTNVYAKARVHNSVGLYRTVVSARVMISQNTKLYVQDGALEGDTDVQKDLHTLDGKWFYSGKCAVENAEWSALDSTGLVIQTVQPLTDISDQFYNDELQLANGITYINVIRIRDALNRTRIEKSDGVTVLISPPYPGYVRDGLAEDLKYQEATDHLSANWNDFGDKTSTDPTQVISRYEVAIGSDLRYSSLRASIHNFVNTGLDTFITFTSLDLTPKSVTYYATVRAYSMSGSYEEAYSSGIKVGYRDGIIGGTVTCNRYQSDIHWFALYWSGFESDIGLNNYYIGIASSNISVINESYSLEDLPLIANFCDVYPATNVNDNTYFESRDVSLVHGQRYYPVVIAVDNAGACKVVTGEPVLVDTTPPRTTVAILAINGRGLSGSFTFVDSSETVNIDWSDIMDPESSISAYNVSVYENLDCTSFDSNLAVLVRFVTVSSQTRVTFRDMHLSANKNYFVDIEVTNNAGLSSFVDRFFFNIDETRPLEGSVKIGADWMHQANYQSSLTSINAWIAIANSQGAYTCPSDQQIFPDSSGSMIWTEESVCVDPCFEYTTDDMKIQIGYNKALTTIDAGCTASAYVKLREGLYTTTMKIANGNNTITSYFIGSAKKAVSTSLQPPVPNNLISDPIVDYDTVSEVNATLTLQNNTAENMQTVIPTDDVSGCGVSIIGEKQENSRYWDGVFWCVDKYGRNEQWFTMDDNPTENSNAFSIRTRNPDLSSWNLDLLINSKQKAVISGMFLSSQVKVYFHTATNNGYTYAKDPFNPYQSSIRVTQVSVPKEQELMCHYGHGFYDPESGMESIWLGVSDSLTEVDNIQPMQIVKKFCQRCKDECVYGCDPDCTSTSDFDVLGFQVTGLNMHEPVIEISSDVVKMLNGTTYYVTAKIINFAGNERVSYSNGIMIDTSPPECESVKCVDPSYSKTQESSFIGNETVAGAFWSCGENISELKEIIVSVTSSATGVKIYQDVNVGLASSVEIALQNGAQFEDGGLYRLNVDVFNTAGRSSSYSCEVTALLTQPVIEALTVSTFFITTADSASNVDWMPYNDRIGISWNDVDADAEFYEWMVGTAPGGQDVLPSFIIGTSALSSFYIIHSHVWINGIEVNWTISDLRDPSQENRNNDSSLFLMEPGRCLYITIQARGPSHLASVVHQQPLCIARIGDATMEASTERQVVVHSYQESMILGQSDSSDLSVNISDYTGEAVIGKLSLSDMTTSYGSAATASFVSYVTNPDMTMDMTSRILTNRILQFLGESVFISPAPVFEFTTIEIKVRIDAAFDSDTYPVLAVWIIGENGIGYWDIVDQECATEPVESSADNYIIITICGHWTDDSINRRRKRETGVTIDTPSQFALFLINQTYSNTAPVLETTSIVMNEDTDLNNSQVFWSDMESDIVILNLTDYHQQDDSLNITTDGLLNFTPPPNFAGIFDVHVMLTENTSLTDPLHTYGVINVRVENVNDAPILLLLSPGGSYFDTRLVHNTTILLEGNMTEHDIGTLVVYDYDEDASFTYLHMASRDGQITNEANVTINTITMDTMLQPVNGSEYVKTSAYANVAVSVQENLTGEIHFHFRTHDDELSYSLEHVVVAYFLHHPCVHGSCAGIDDSGPECNNIIRAETFSPFYCECDTGYEGEWCADEINECQTIGCSWMYYCIDKIGNVECNINYSKLIPVTIFSILAFTICIGVGLFVRHKFGENSQKKAYGTKITSVTNLLCDADGAGPVPIQQAWAPTSTAFRYPDTLNKKPQFVPEKSRRGDGIDLPLKRIPSSTSYSDSKENEEIFRNDERPRPVYNISENVKHAWLDMSISSPFPGTDEKGFFGIENQSGDLEEWTA